MSASPEVEARVLVYGKPECHLCDVALEVVERVCAETGHGFSSVDISDSAELRARFGEFIPVVFVDGRQLDFFRVDEQRLRAALG